MVRDVIGALEILVHSFGIMRRKGIIALNVGRK
jgi:hypothetical protein